ncbi:MAG: DUF47 domain-containing protein [Gemmatimonadaceae bacterium]|nr:DUF47 domain-containing protein [Gemmatimonadaceae bacterium]
MRLIPKDEGFFELFDALADRMTQSAAVLEELFAHPERLEEHAQRIKALEHEADGIMLQVVTRLDQSFVTPLDREDIHALATRLDNVVDLMDGTARRAKMFHIKTGREPAIQLTDILVRATTTIKEAVQKLRQPKEVARLGRVMKALEEEGDAVYSDAVGALFSGDTSNPIEIITWKELYDNIEHAIDECEDVLNVLGSISIKNS